MATRKPLGLTSDFTRIAARYDATRNVPKRHLLTCYDRLVERGFVPACGRILDAGCGTGQLSLPLAERGYDVHGIDVSKAMIERALKKADRAWRARYEVGDARDIPYADGHFDAVIVSKLLQHIEDWQTACRELVRVVRPGACVIHVNERGAFGNAVRRYFSKRADELGFARRYLGLDPRSQAEPATFMLDQGCQAIAIDMSDLRWSVEVRYGDALRQIRDRLFAEFWSVPPDVHDRLVAETAAWVEAQPGGRDAVEKLAPYLAVELFRRPAENAARP